MCVEKCEDFAYNYVSSDETGKCEYCGPTCTLCSAKYGCLEDHRFDRGYKCIIGEEYYPANEFPYSDSAPSSQFSTAKECSDSRCDACEKYDNEVVTTGGFP